MAAVMKSPTKNKKKGQKLHPDCTNKTQYIFLPLTAPDNSL
jgi:hypothetical protein